MKRMKGLWGQHSRALITTCIVGGILAGLLLYKLGSLMGGMSSNEIATVQQPLGWSGIWALPFELPLKLVQSVLFFAQPDHGSFIARLPNVLFGATAVLALGWVIATWHNLRTTMFTMLLFATSAWVLHVSRVATTDVLYLWALPMLLVTQVLLHAYKDRPQAWYGCIALWGILLYIPGMVWLIVAQIILQRRQIRQLLQQVKTWPARVTSLILAAVWLPLLVIGFTRTNGLMLWLGLPQDFASPLTIVKDIAAVPYHLLVRGPEYPDIWLGRLPILDAFTLIMCLLGIYFYVSHWRSSRSRFLGVMTALGVVLIGVGGPVKFSLLVPLLYVCVATGIAYILQSWLKVFPRNPIARGLGIGLVSLAVALSCVYNLRAYFVAWPHNQAAQSIFRYHL